MENQMTDVSGKKTTFVKESTEKYQVPKDVDRCYFFNPFSVKILQKALVRILDSYYENPRELELFFYYPSDDYVGYLIAQEQLMFVDEIDCRDIFGRNNAREKILIFKVI